MLGGSNLVPIFSWRDHCVKIVHIRSYSAPYFLAFGLNTERCRIFLLLQSECGKIRTRITPNTDTFHAVDLSNSSWNVSKRHEKKVRFAFFLSSDILYEGLVTNINQWLFFKFWITRNIMREKTGLDKQILLHLSSIGIKYTWIYRI